MTTEPHRKLEVELGDRIKFHGERLLWTVQAVSENFVAVVRQTPFEPKGYLQYSVIDWRNGVRGPCNMVGQGYGDGTYTVEECTAMLKQFEFDPQTDPARVAALAAGRTSWVPTEWHLEVSHRNRVRIHIDAINGELVVRDMEAAS